MEDTNETSRRISQSSRSSGHDNTSSAGSESKSSGHANGMPGDTPSGDLEKQDVSDNNGGSDPEKQFEVHWDGDNDSMDPRRMSKPRKWLIISVLAMTSVCVTCTSSIYTMTYDQITKEFHCSKEVAILGLSLFVMTLGIGPMLLAPLSEFYGRRPVYIGSLALFLIWLIPSAVAKNIQTMLIARSFQGFIGSAFLSVAGGTVGDIFISSELQLPMAVYTASPFVGPEMGPLIGGFISQYTTWRWTQYVLLIWSGAMLVLIVLFVPETYHPVILRNKARKLRAETGNQEWKAPIEKITRSIPTTIAWSCLRPFQLLIFEPMVLNLCLLSALLLGILYLFFGAFQLVFQHNHHFQLFEVGLTFLGMLFGMIAGIMTNPFFHRNYLRLVRKREAQGGEPGGSEPEYRLPPAIMGAILVPIGLFWFGWTSYSSVHWIVPIIGSAIFGMG
ncbi:MAG: hypothetical protein M1819_001754 [Sarea resinae]|nr:MAG: hypothetical protein M1819_001754 [Sarea resinae]